jgi:hypothetical protein
MDTLRAESDGPDLRIPLPLAPAVPVFPYKERSVYSNAQTLQAGRGHGPRSHWGPKLERRLR